MTIFLLIILIFSCKKDQNPISTNTNKTFTLYGYISIITSNDTTHLSNAIVNLDSMVDTTNQFGYYEFSNVDHGNHILSIHHTNYQIIDTIIFLNDNIQFDYCFNKNDYIPLSLKLFGHISLITPNDTTYLSDAIVNLDSMVDTTNLSGYYEFNNVDSGNHILSIMHSRYQLADSIITLNDSTQLDFNIITVDYFPMSVGNEWLYSFESYSFAFDSPRIWYDYSESWEVINFFEEDSSFIFELEARIVGIKIVEYWDPIIYKDTTNIDSIYNFIIKENSNHEILFLNHKLHWYRSETIFRYNSPTLGDTIEFSLDNWPYENQSLLVKNVGFIKDYVNDGFVGGGYRHLYTLDSFIIY